MQEVLKKLQDSNTKQSTQILKLNESVATIYKKVESTDSTINRLYKEQVRANNAAAAAAKRAAADAKRKSADNPLKRMFEKQEKKQKDGNDLLGKILAALAGLGGLSAVISGSLGGLKDLVVKALKNAFSSLFGPNGFLRSALKAIFGKEGFLRKALGNLFGKDSFLRKGLGRIFGKEGFLRKSIGKIFGKEGFLRKTIGKAFSKLGNILPKGLKNLGKTLAPVLKLLGNFTKGAGGILAKGTGAVAKGAGGLLAKGAGGLAKFALKRGPFAALFAAGDELLGEDPKLGRAAARGGGAAAGAGIGASVGSIVPVVGTIIGGALGAALGDFLGGFLYDNFSDVFKPLDDFGVQIGETFNNIKEGFTNWWSGVTTKFTEIKDGIGKLWTDVSTTVTNVAESIGSVLEVVTRPYREFLGEAVRLGKNLFKVGTDFVGGYFKMLKDFGGKAIGFVKDKILKPASSAFDALSKVLKPITDLLGRLAGGILDGVVGTFEKISNFFGQGGGKGILETASNLNPLNLLTDVVGKLNDKLEGNKNLPGRKSGGWISGPQSGYPVSLDGGMSASFIGHGTEYVAQRSSGGFVVPVDTPSTRSNPGLTQQRINEATGSGFNLSGMNGYSAGGIVQAKHPDTGPGWSVGKDSQQRPSVFTKTAAEAFVETMKASDGAVKTSDITSSQRSVAKNRAEGGVPNSNHLIGHAVDIHGTSKAWLKQNGPEYGWKNLVYSGHDGHFDFTKGMGGYDKAQGDGREKTADGDGSGALKIETKMGGLGGGPAGIMKGIMGAGLGAMKNIPLIGEFFKGFEEGFNRGLDPNSPAAALANIIFGGSKSDSSTSKDENSDSISSNTSLGSGGGNLTTMTDQQWSDLAYAVSGEAQPNTDDDFGVAANILTRVADPSYPNTIMGVFTQPKQYAAYSDGSARRDEELAQRLKTNQSKIADALKQLNGRQSFKGTSMYENMNPDTDIKFSSRGNFYHYDTQRLKSDPAPSSPPQHWKKFIEEEKSTKSEGNKVEQIIKGLPWTPWLQNNTATSAASGHLGDAIRSELQNKPVGSELVIANSSETIIPQGKIKGRQTSNGWIDSSMNQAGQASVIIINSPSPSGGGNVPMVAESGGGTPQIPSMSSGPTTPIASLLMTQTYLMADRIG